MSAPSTQHCFKEYTDTGKVVLGRQQSHFTKKKIRFRVTLGYVGSNYYCLG